MRLQTRFNMDLISRQKNNRGKTLSGAPTVLQYTLDELKKEVNSYKHKKDYYQDFMLFWKQKDIKEIMASKYGKHECDTRLVSNYKDLIGQIQIFIDLVQPQRYHSRNIVFANKNCCISLIQFYNDQMIVYCRSTDLLRGLKCDLSWFYGIAGRGPMKIEYFTIVLGVPHRYLKDIQHKELKKGGKDNGSKR